MTESPHEKAQKFIADHSKMQEDGLTRTVTQADFLRYLQDEHQINSEVIKTKAVGEKQLISGAIAVASIDLANAVTEAKKNGNDPADLSAKIRIARPDGALSLEVHAERIHTNPRDHSKSTHYGVVGLRAKTNVLIDASAAERARDLIATHMS